MGDKASETLTLGSRGFCALNGFAEAAALVLFQVSTHRFAGGW